MAMVEEVDLVEDNAEIFDSFHAIEDLSSHEEITRFHWPPCFLFPSMTSTISSPNFIRKLCYFLYCDACATQVLNVLEIPHIIPSSQERMYGVMVGDLLRLPQGDEDGDIYRRIENGEEKEGMIESVSRPVKIIVLNSLMHFSSSKQDPILWIQDHEGTWYELMKPCRFEYNSVFQEIEQALLVKGDETAGYGRKYVNSITEYAIYNQQYQQDSLINFQSTSVSPSYTWTILGKVPMTLPISNKKVSVWIKIDIKDYEVHFGGRDETQENDKDHGIWICSHQGAWYKLQSPFPSYASTHHKMMDDLLSPTSYDHRNAFYKDFHRTVTNYSFLDNNGYFIAWHKIMKVESDSKTTNEEQYYLLRGNLISKESSDAPSLVPMAVYVKKYIVDLGKKPGDELTLFVQGLSEKVWYKLQGDPAYAYKTFKDVPRDLDSYVRLFNWPSETKEVWRRVNNFTVMDAKGKMVSIIVNNTNKTAFLRGWMIPHKSSNGVKNVQLSIQIYLDRYSIDYGTNIDDPNRGFWLQDVHNHWYKVEEPPSAEYQEVAREGLQNTQEFLRLHEAMIFMYCDEICEADATGMAVCKYTIQEVFEVTNFHFDLKFIQQNKDFVESNLTALISVQKSRKFFNSIKNLTAEEVDAMYKTHKNKIQAAMEVRIKEAQKAQAAREAKEAKEVAKEAAKEANKAAKAAALKESSTPDKKELTPAKKESKEKDVKEVEKANAKRRYTAADIHDSDFEFSSDEETKTPQKKAKPTEKVNETPSASKRKEAEPTPAKSSSSEKPDSGTKSSIEKLKPKRSISDENLTPTPKTITKRVFNSDDEEEQFLPEPKKPTIEEFESSTPNKSAASHNGSNSNVSSNGPSLGPTNGSSDNIKVTKEPEDAEASTPRKSANGNEKPYPKKDPFPCSYCKGAKKSSKCMNRAHVDGYLIGDAPRGSRPQMVAAFCSTCNSLAKKRYCNNRAHREGELVMVPKVAESENLNQTLPPPPSETKKLPTISVIGTCSFCKTLQKRLSCPNKDHKDGEMVTTIKTVDPNAPPEPSPRPSTRFGVTVYDEDDEDEELDNSKLRIAEEKEKERYYRFHHHDDSFVNNNTPKSSLNLGLIKTNVFAASTRSIALPLPYDKSLKPKKSALKKESSLPAASADPILLQLESALVSTSSDKPGVKWKDMEGRSNLREVFVFETLVEEYDEPRMY